jgi:hypothetical protein
MSASNQYQSDCQHVLRDWLRCFVVTGLVLLIAGVGVPVALMALAIAVCAVLPDEWQFGSIPMLALIVIDAFPCGWALSGLGSWLIGRHWSGNDRTVTVLGLRLEDCGVMVMGIGLLAVGIVSIICAKMT